MCDESPFLQFLSHCCHIAVTLLSHYYHIIIPLPHITITLLSPCCHTTLILLSLKPFLLKKSISHPNNWLISSEKSHISSKMSLVFSKMSLVFPKMSLVFWKKWHIIKERVLTLLRSSVTDVTAKNIKLLVYTRARTREENKAVHRLSCANCACTFAVKREEDGEHVAFFL